MLPAAASGTCVAAPRPVVRLVHAWALVLGGCLITDPAQIYDPLNSPPSIRSSPGAVLDNLSMNRIITLTYDEGASLQLPIIVRDENIGDDIQYQVWIDYVPGTSGQPLFSEALAPVLAPTGVPDRATSISIPHARFGAIKDCHRVEVFATSEFAATNPPHQVPVIEGDLGTATFWVVMKVNPDDVVNMSECP